MTFALTTFVTRLVARARARALDEKLADGVNPSVSPELEVRAMRLRRTRIRRRIASALQSAVTSADRPVERHSIQVPVDGDAVRSCAADLLELATSLARLERPRAQGVAIASRLAFDGGGPLFARPGHRRDARRLRNTVRAANAALRVSASFDEP